MFRLCLFVYMCHLRSALSFCEVSVRTLNFGCHLDWKCPGAGPETTYTVQSLAHGTSSWENVSDCIRISRQSCDLSHTFPYIHNYNFMRLASDGLQDWTSDQVLCDPIQDTAATFSSPSITVSMENGSIWVTVRFPCAPAVSCRFEEKDEDDEESDVETHCPCSLFESSGVSAVLSVTLYNKHNPSDTQTRSATGVEEKSVREEFGFWMPGQVYCARANFTTKGLRVASPLSAPQCVETPAKSQSLMIVVVCAVVVTLGLMFILLWRQCSSPEPSLPKSLVLLHDHELQNTTFLDFSRAGSDHRSSGSERISVVSLLEFTLVENQTYSPCQSLGNGYYRSPVLQDPDCAEECLKSGDLETDGTDCFDLHPPSHWILEGGEQSPYLDECEKTLNIPLSSVRVNHTGQEETTDAPQQYRDVKEDTEEQESIV